MVFSEDGLLTDVNYLHLKQGGKEKVNSGGRDLCLEREKRLDVIYTTHRSARETVGLTEELFN